MNANSRTAKSGGLPERWRRGRMIAGLVSVVLVAAILYPLREYSRADGIDSWWLAARFAFREILPVRRVQDPNIVLVVIDENSVGQDVPDAWHEPAIAWNPHLAQTLDLLRVSGAKAIGIDRIQPERTAKWLKARG